MRRAAALAIALLAAACTSPAQAAYQADLDCFAFFHDVPANSGSPEAAAARATYRERTIASGRAVGLGPAEVETQARAGHAAFQAELAGLGAHPAEERMEEKHNACLARLQA